MKCGVVDVGSNTIRLSIYHWERDGSMKLLMNRKVMAGLAGYIQDGVMSDSGILVACRTLAGFRSLLDNFEIQDMYVFGTAPLRNIVNTEDALNAIEEITGFRVEVLSGADEAALSFRGAALGCRLSRLLHDYSFFQLLFHGPEPVKQGILADFHLRTAQLNQRHFY